MKKDTFVDCTKRGGYDPADKCKQTCLSKKDITDEDACSLRCTVTSVFKMKFHKPADKAIYIKNC